MKKTMYTRELYKEIVCLQKVHIEMMEKEVVGVYHIKNSLVNEVWVEGSKANKGTAKMLVRAMSCLQMIPGTVLTHYQQ